MKVIVLGASKGMGRSVVHAALEAGFEVTAFSRNPETLEKHRHLRLVAGDVCDYDDVAVALPGHGAVIYTVGLGTYIKPQEVRTKGMENVRRAMEQANVERLICLSALGVGDSAIGAGRVYNWLIKPLFTRNIVADQEGMERIVKGSTLDWTLVRPPRLVDKRKPKAVRVSSEPTFSGTSISRADVADFILGQLSSKEYLKKAVSLAW